MTINDIENEIVTSLAKISVQTAEMPDRASCINDAPKVGTGPRGRSGKFRHKRRANPHAFLYSVASTTCLTSARMMRHNSFNHFKIKAVMESFANVSNLYQVAEIELIYKSKVQASQRPKIESSRDAYKVLMQSWNPDRLEFIEEFKILLLNNASRVLGIFEVSKGGISGASADIRIVFAAALKANATGIILAHNHPSGQLVPSDADRYVTENMRKAGELLNIRVLDHLIVTTEGFCSFVDDGFMGC